MFTISSDSVLGTIKIYDSFAEGNNPIFTYPEQDYKLSFINLQDVKYFKSFTYSTTGETKSRYLVPYYRVSKNGKEWTNWLEATTFDNFPPFDPKYNMFIDVKWIRKGDSKIGQIKIINYNLEGTLYREIADGINTIKLNSTNTEIIIKPPYIYKIFKINDIEILSKGDLDNLSISYRYSQDYGRTVTNFTDFTKENIKSERINPIRFFQIEYLLKYNGSSNISIFDINLIGDFQNVTLDGQKSNLYGIRENCNCLILNIVGDSTTVDLPPGGLSSMLMSPYTTESTNLPKLTSDDLAKLYQPYQQAQALTLFNKMSNDALNIFGHDVVYVLTDPDKNGTDYTFHEYQLQNYICDAKLKVAVDQNQFPDNNGALNNFDLTLFESFEINITKDAFKLAFGVQSRPGKDDVIWFCNLNKLYTIEHAHAIRNFNNYSIYYKIMLKKFNQKANIIGATQELQNVIDNLTANSTIDELLGLENRQDKKSVSNTEQFRSHAQETLRQEIYAKIEKENIENASVILAKTHYDLSSIEALTNAVVYRNLQNFFDVSNNLGYMAWFNINNITTNDVYNFFEYFDNITNTGLKINMIGNSILVTINDITHTLNFSNLTSNVLQEETWYALVVNIDQRQSLLNAYIYKRNVEYEEDAVYLTSSKLSRVYKLSTTITPTVIEVSASTNASILASDMKITNIRLFIDVIPEAEHNKLLNYATVGSDYKFIIFADHANQKIVLPFYEDSKAAYNKIRRGTDLDTN